MEYNLIMKRFNFGRRIGLGLIIAGLVVWSAPFIVVAIDNSVGTTKPADSLISSLGLFIIIVGPILVLSGLLVITVRAVKKIKV